MDPFLFAFVVAAILTKGAAAWKDPELVKERMQKRDLADKAAQRKHDAWKQRQTQRANERAAGRRTVGEALSDRMAKWIDRTVDKDKAAKKRRDDADGEMSKGRSWWEDMKALAREMFRSGLDESRQKWDPDPEWEAVWDRDQEGGEGPETPPTTERETDPESQSGPESGPGPDPAAGGPSDGQGGPGAESGSDPDPVEPQAPPVEDPEDFVPPPRGGAGWTEPEATTEPPRAFGPEFDPTFVPPPRGGTTEPSKPVKATAERLDQKGPAELPDQDRRALPPGSSGSGDDSAGPGWTINDVFRELTEGVNAMSGELVGTGGGGRALAGSRGGALTGGGAVGAISGEVTKPVQGVVYCMLFRASVVNLLVSLEEQMLSADYFDFNAEAKGYVAALTEHMNLAVQDINMLGGIYTGWQEVAKHVQEKKAPTTKRFLDED
jgi:hypothetical protein